MTYKPLISGQNIKTVNSNSLLGSGNLVVSSNIDYTELWLKFNGTNNSTEFIDESKNDSFIILAGVPIISTAQSKFGGSSLYLDGNSCLLIPSYRDFINTSKGFTIEFWSYLPIFQGNQSVINFNSNYGTNGFSMRLANDKIGIDNTTVGTVDSPSVLILATWQHIAITKYNNVLYFYVDGMLKHQIALQIYTGTNIVSIGRYASGGVISNFNGYIDNLRISSKAIYTSILYPNGFTLPDENFNVTAL